MHFFASRAVFSNVEKETAFWIGVFVFILGVNYEIQTIKEKLDSIQASLYDLHAGGSGRFDDLG